MRSLKKILKIVLTAGISITLFFAAVSCVPCIFGIYPYIVRSGSMEPEIHTGSLVFVDTNHDYKKLMKGDVIAFEPKEDTLVTHRILNIDNELIETKGDNNDVSDGYIVNPDNYIGLTKFSVPQLGYFFAWTQTERGIIVTITAGIAMILFDYLIDKEEKGGDDD